MWNHTLGNCVKVYLVGSKKKPSWRKRTENFVQKNDPISVVLLFETNRKVPETRLANTGSYWKKSSGQIRHAIFKSKSSVKICVNKSVSNNDGERILKEFV